MKILSKLFKKPSVRQQILEKVEENKKKGLSLETARFEAICDYLQGKEE